jgi:sterol desaturase/sphingolipid hydroxylase (fatty acid hydroxylase superfamily)
VPTVLSLTAGLALLSAAFFVLERLTPGTRGQQRARADTLTDLGYWFFTPLVTRAATRGVLALVFVMVARSRGLTFAELRSAVQTRPTWLTPLPLWVQVPLMLLAADLLAYATHRAFHGRLLWRFHAIHHSSTVVDWLSSVRLHPVNDVVTRAAQVLPLYWLGFNAAALTAFVPILAFYALLLHANLDWTFGPLRYVLASPVFHRWHHTAETEGLDTNFAGLFPFIDLAFGTFYMPRGRVPARFGLAGEPMPTGLWSQLRYPFVRR